MREHTDGDFPHGNDFTAIALALADQAAIVSGCSVDDGGTTDMSVSVASGTARIGGSKVSVSSQSVALAASDPDYDRYDLVVVDSTGSASTVTGTASSTPTAPAIPASSALLAIVYVPAGVAGVTDSEIKGARAVFAAAQALDDHASAGNPHSDSASSAALSNHENASNPHSGSASSSALNDHKSAGNPHSNSASLAQAQKQALAISLIKGI